MTNVPTPETVGSKRLPETPVPLKVPPAGVPVKVTNPALIQTGPTGVIVTTGSALIVTLVVVVLEQVPLEKL
ncbi:MAG: hypothetical protein IPH84_06800 [Bacteroidales bacterium]|nr:hypothetical protein [Bacteroidales bacterium]